MIWTAYLCGAFLVLALKYTTYLYRHQMSKHPKHLGHHWKQASLEWILGVNLEGEQTPGKQSATSWVTTIGIVWLFGSWVVSQQALGLLPDALAGTASHAALAFTIGSIMELVAPRIAKGLIDGLVAFVNKKGDG
jgi:hypothetical protein